MTKFDGPAAPSDCGRRLLVHLIDERASQSHSRPFASIPLGLREVDRYRDVSYASLANAINRSAQWILENIGPPALPNETMVYLAQSDLRYQILALAATKAGYIMFFPSPRNTRESFQALMKECKSTKLLTTTQPPPSVKLIEGTQQMVKYIVPSLEILLDDELVAEVPFSLTWQQCRFRPFLQIHSSGSTGTPKLMTLTHGSLTAVDAFQLLETNELFQRFGNMRMFVSFPPFHVAGIIYSLASPCWVDSTVVLPPPKPLTAELVNFVHTSADVEFSLLPPSLVMDLAKDSSFLQNLNKLSGLTFAGGPLPESTGSMIAAKTRLLAGYGATEWQAVPQLTKEREDWPYIRFNSQEGGLDFRERMDGLYEMVICRDPNYELAQAVFFAFPDIQEWYSKDLFSKHPTKVGLWKYVSRLDDLIVLSNGEKLNPVAFEGLVSSSPLVNGCVMVGQGRFQSGLLVEPKDPQISQSDLMTNLWPLIQSANQVTVKHGRVVRELVLRTSPDKPLPRAGKGTIQRAAANQVYASEIDQLYFQIEAAENHKSATYMDFSSFETTKASLIAFLSHEMGLSVNGDEDDFFAAGMDSLQLISLVRAINGARPERAILAKQIYDYPTIRKLAESLVSNKDDIEARAYDSDDEVQKQAWLTMDKMYHEITSSSHRSGNHGPSRYIHGWLMSGDGPVIQPDGGWLAWSQVFACFLVNFNNWGLVNAFGVFQDFYQNNVLAAYSPSAISWIGTVQGSLLLVVGVLSGPLFDHGYFRSILLLGGIGLVFALMMLSLSTQYYQIFLSQGLLLGISSGLLYIPSVALVPVWFKHRRGLALGIATGGGPIGGIVYPIMFTRLLDKTGFPWAVRSIAFIALGTIGAAVLMSRSMGPRIRRQLIDSSAFTELPYVTFMCAAFLVFSAVLIPFFLGSTFALTELGSSAAFSSDVLPILNAAQFLGRLLPAWASDYHFKIFGPEVILLIAEAVLGVLGFSWIAVRSIGGFIPWLLVTGFLSGITGTLAAVVLPSICPDLAAYGTRLGMLYGAAGLGVLISTPIAAAANHSTGSFLGSQIWMGSCCLGAAILISITAYEARKGRLRMQSGEKRRQWKKTKRGRPDIVRRPYQKLDS